MISIVRFKNATIADGLCNEILAYLNLRNSKRRIGSRYHPLGISSDVGATIWPRLAIIFSQCPGEIDNRARSKGKHRRPCKRKPFIVRCAELAV